MQLTLMPTTATSLLLHMTLLTAQHYHHSSIYALPSVAVADNPHVQIAAARDSGHGGQQWTELNTAASVF